MATISPRRSHPYPPPPSPPPHPPPPPYPCRRLVDLSSATRQWHHALDLWDNIIFIIISTNLTQLPLQYRLTNHALGRIFTRTTINLIYFMGFIKVKKMQTCATINRIKLVKRLLRLEIIFLKGNNNRNTHIDWAT